MVMLPRESAIAMSANKCQICESLQSNPLGFNKRNGKPYVEAHHVIFVSRGGSLSAANLITVCANHHRQLHYGRTALLKTEKRKFIFDIDGVNISIPRLLVTKSRQIPVHRNPLTTPKKPAAPRHRT